MENDRELGEIELSGIEPCEMIIGERTRWCELKGARAEGAVWEGELMGEMRER